MRSQILSTAKDLECRPLNCCAGSGSPALRKPSWRARCLPCVNVVVVVVVVVVVAAVVVVVVVLVVRVVVDVAP